MSGADGARPARTPGPRSSTPAAQLVGLANLGLSLATWRTRVIDGA